MLKKKARSGARNLKLEKSSQRKRSDFEDFTSPPPFEGNLERQLFFPGQDLAGILKVIQKHRSGFESIYRPRELQTIYFAKKAANPRGVALMDLILRSPLRLRWYADQPSNVRALVESGERRQIYKHPLFPFDMNYGSWQEVLKRVCRSDEYGDLREKLSEAPHPLALCQSRRFSFVSADGRIRLTIEELLSVCIQDLNGRPNLQRKTLHAPLLLLEMRASSFDRLGLDCAAQEFAKQRKLLNEATPGRIVLRDSLINPIG